MNWNCDNEQNERPTGVHYEREKNVLFYMRQAVNNFYCIYTWKFCIMPDSFGQIQ